VREWYRNGPLGLEQGFEIARAPRGHASGAPLTLDMALHASVPARLSKDGQRLTFTGGSTSLQYRGLVATDAAGAKLSSHLTLHGDTLSIAVDVRHARFPLTIDPLIQQGPKRTSGEAEGESLFGTSAALSGDGRTLLIGGPRDNGSRGAAWVFARSGGSWSQQGAKWAGAAVRAGGGEECIEESAEEAGECAFGASVALSADGNTALVGAPSRTSAAGLAWVFSRTGSEWSSGEPLPMGGGEEVGAARFGRSVALSADGNTALIGDPSSDLGRGSAFLFTRPSGGPWTPSVKLAGSEARAGAHFGRSVAISSDGSRALVGAPGDSGYAGAAWSFARHGSTWVAAATKLVGAGEVGNGHFGKSVALSGDGTTALVGARDDAEEQGAVWPFVLSGESFELQGEKISGAVEAESQFGSSVALSQDGNLALIGAAAAESGIGTAVEYSRSSASTWTAVAPALGGTEAAGKGATGTSVALSQSGEVAAIGAPRDARRAGAAWIFSLVPPPEVPGPSVKAVAPGHGPAEGGTTVTISGANFTGEAQPIVMFGAVAALSVTVKSSAQLTAVSPAGVLGTSVDVTVKTATGQSEISNADRFKYEGLAQSNGKGGSGSSGNSTGSPKGAAGVLGSAEAAGTACLVSLRSKRVAVASHRTARIRLLRSGSGLCSGTLTLRYQQHRPAGRRIRMRTIGSARFSIAPGASQVVSIRLSRLGRALFVARHGRLSVSAAVVRTTPSPVLAKVSSVRLSVKKQSKAKRAEL
jgi:hypothetical protein